MIKFKDHVDMIGCWEEAGRPLNKETVDAIEKVSSELKTMGEEDVWLVFEGKCRICNFEQNIICPIINDLDNQECANCEHMTMQEKEIPDWEVVE
ncbi:hypothetical protein LCGC14_0664070 [marine sediment metagenome]|uniref:Uncharacterized protein n=1 Tax=marine sediment metagenome TaxID=412755 RepID=A0A0F9RCW0_9ZZZZ